MKFSNELIAKAKAAKSGTEILALAKANNIEMTEEQASEYYAELHKSGELADDELGNVAGGWCQDPCPHCGKYAEQYLDNELSHRIWIDEHHYRCPIRCRNCQSQVDVSKMFEEVGEPMGSDAYRGTYDKTNIGG